jgi:hypothetical protein
MYLKWQVGIRAATRGPEGLKSTVQASDELPLRPALTPNHGEPTKFLSRMQY